MRARAFLVAVIRHDAQPDHSAQSGGIDCRAGDYIHWPERGACVGRCASHWHHRHPRYHQRRHWRYKRFSGTNQSWPWNGRHAEHRDERRDGSSAEWREYLGIGSDILGPPDVQRRDALG
jgi:hypothetical protein